MKPATARPCAYWRLLLPLCILSVGLASGFLTGTASAGQALPVGDRIDASDRFDPAALSAGLELAASDGGSGPADEPGRIYFGRDERGNRIFGTDDKSPAGFYTDPESGDRMFRTAPPPKADEGNWGDSHNLWITPEVKPGKRPDRPGLWPPAPPVSGWR